MASNISPSVDSVDLTSSNTNASTALNWASEWVGYIALCMFSLVLVVPTLGIVGLMVWEYFNDEAERKAERKKEIDQAMEQHFGGNSLESLKKKKRKRQKLQQQLEQEEKSQKFTQDICIDDVNDNCLIDDEFDDDDDDEEDSDSESLHDVDNVLKQADHLLNKRIRKRNISSKSNDAYSADNFDEILT